MLDLKHGQIKTMAQDIASLQGKFSKDQQSGSAKTIEPDLENRLMSAILESERRNMPPNVAVTETNTLSQNPPVAIQETAHALPKPPAPGQAPAPPMPDQRPVLQAHELTANERMEKELEDQINKEMMAALPQATDLWLEKNSAEKNQPPAANSQKPEATDKIQPKESKEEIKPAQTPETEKRQEKPTIKSSEQKSETEIEEKIKKELVEKKKETKILQSELEEKYFQEERERKLEEKIAKEKEAISFSEKEKDRLERKNALVLPVLLAEAKERIHVDRIEVEKHLLDLATKNEPLENQKIQLMAEVELARTGELSLIIGKETEIEEKKEHLGKTSQGNLALADEKLLSKRLWDLEDKRKQIERRRWEIEDQITRSEIEIKKIELELAEKNKERNKIGDIINKLISKEKLIDFIGKKKTWLEKIKQIEKEKEILLPNAEIITNEKNSNEETLKELIESEKAITEELKMVEEKEKESLTYDEKRVIEKMRWKVESDMRKTIKEKWQHVLAKEKIEATEKESLSEIEKADKRQKEIEDEISAEEIILEKEGINIKMIRDEVGTILNETGFDFDASILEEIDQSDIVGTNGYGEEETWVPKEKTEIANPEKKTELKITGPPAKDRASEERKPVSSFREDGDYRKKDGSAQTVPVQPAAQEPINEMPPRINRETFSETPQSPSPFLEPINNNNGGVPAQNTARPFDNGRQDSFSPSLGDTATTAGSEISQSYKAGSPLEEDGQPENPWTNRWSQAQKPSFPNQEIMPLATPSAAKKNPQPNDDFLLTEDLPEKSSSGKKLMIRVLILLICLVVIGAAVLIVFTKKTPAAPSDEPNNENTDNPNNNGDDASGADTDSDGVLDGQDNCPSTANPEQTDTDSDGVGDDCEDADENPDDDVAPKPEPASLITAISTLDIKANNDSEVSDALSTYLQRSFEGEGYYRVLIQNKDNDYLGFKEFLALFNTKTPDTLFNNLTNNFTLFVYASKGDNRLGFVTEVSNADGINDILKKWEGTMEKDLDGLFKLLGKKTNASPSFFKTGAVPNSKQTFRYLSFPLPPSNKNSGLCYATTEKYFILTSSGESLIKIFNQLEN